MERVPRARLRPYSQDDAHARDFRPAQSIQRPAVARRRLHLLLDGASMSRVLVTGGAGYIGSHAVKALLASGHEVVVYDNLSAGHRAAVRVLADGQPDGRLTFVEGDIRDTARVAGALRESKADAVMPFAAWLSVGDSVKDPAGYYDNNVR